MWCNFIFILSFNAWIVLSHELPNILIVLTDDQDVELHGMSPLVQTNRLVGHAGVRLSNVFTNTPLCCPSRASLLSGQFAHNHRTINNSMSGGCNSDHWQKSVEPLALPVLLHNHGYTTLYAGKYLNEYRGRTVPPGWDEFYGLLGNSRYYNYTLRENAKNVSYTDTYLTDLLRDKALEFLGKDPQHPFFMIIAPPAAHAPFTPAPRHNGVFANVKALRTPNFNHIVNSPLDKHWLVASAQRIHNKTLNTIDEYFQKRWETLLSVDEMVAALVKKLDEVQRLENTYIVFTSDNGYHLGQFALPFDKRQPYETDIRIPMLIRGPNVPADSTLQYAVSLVDLAPTILEWAGIDVPSKMDGESFNRYLIQTDSIDATLEMSYRRTLLIEYWGEGNNMTYNPKCPGQRSDNLAQCNPDAECHCQDARNNTYACVRDFRFALDRIYCQFQDQENFVEAYDLTEDPYQMTNLGYDLLPIERALYELLLNNLTKCAGSSCHV